MLHDWFERVYKMDRDEISRRFPLLAAGSSRLVYTVNRDFVIKVATKRDGYDQCSRENRVYKNVDNSLKRYLCPVVWYRPGMIAMQRAVPILPLHMLRGDPQISAPDSVYRDLMVLSKRFNLLYEDLLSETSWGYLGNRLVLIDYGCRK